MRDALALLSPSHAVPVTRWRSGSRWRTSPSTLLVLSVGLWIFGAGEAMLVHSHLGNGPWTVLAQGVSDRIHISIGLATFLVSLVVLVLWIPLRERPGLGTLANALVIAVSLQVTNDLLPEVTGPWLQLLMVFAGIAMIGLGSGLYLTTNLGPGPRDGWMTGIHLRTDWPISIVRLGIEVFVIVVGWLLGGTVGIGTVLFALLIGPAVGYGLRLAGAVGGAAGRIADEDHPEFEA